MRTCSVCGNRRTIEEYPQGPIIQCPECTPKPGKWDDLPTWQELVDLTGWIGQGCPAGHRNYDARRMVNLAYKLVDNLPKHLPHYAYGTPEWREELARLKQLDRRIICYADGCDGVQIEGSDYCAHHQG